MTATISDAVRQQPATGQISRSELRERLAVLETRVSILHEARDYTERRIRWLETLVAVSLAVQTGWFVYFLLSR